MPLCGVPALRDALRSPEGHPDPCISPSKRTPSRCHPQQRVMGGRPERICYNGRYMMNKVGKVLVAAFLCLLAILGVIRWMASKMIVVPPGL